MSSLHLSLKIVAVAATAVLALLGVIGNPNRPLVWVLAAVCALVVVLIELVRWRQDGIISNSLGKRYEEIVASVWRLIADLSDLTGRRFDLWVVDLYLPRTSFSFAPSWAYPQSQAVAVHSSNGCSSGFLES